MTTQRESSWVNPRRRALKAAQLAVSLRTRDIALVTVARFTPADRRAAEKFAGVRKSSEATWRQAIDMLAGSAHTHARCPFCGHGDPEGIPGPPKPFGHAGPCSK